MDQLHSKITVCLAGIGFIVWMYISKTLDPLLTLAAILIHELGHWLAAILLRIPLGGFRLISYEARLSLSGGLIPYGKEILLSVAGPFFNLLSVVIAGHMGATVFGKDTLSFFATVSAALAVLNLLPIGNMDGGRIVYCLLLKFIDVKAAFPICRILSFFTLFCLWCVSVYLLLHTDRSLALFFFSTSLFTKFFMKDPCHEF